MWYIRSMRILLRSCRVFMLHSHDQEIFELHNHCARPPGFLIGIIGLGSVIIENTPRFNLLT